MKHHASSRHISKRYVYKVIDSPVGRLTLVATRRRAGRRSCGRTNARAACGSRSTPEDAGHPVLVEAERQLREYFAGQRTTFSLALDVAGTAFQRACGTRC